MANGPDRGSRRLRTVLLVGAGLWAGALLGAMPARSQELQPVPREQTLIMATQPTGTSFQNARNYNPFGAGNDARNHISYMLEPLFYWSYFTQELIPWLATGYEYSPDYTSLTLKLREGVTWSDGQTFDADDVVYTIEMLRTHPDMRWGAETKQAVRSVEKLGPYEVRVNLTTPDPRFLYSLLVVYFNKGIWMLPEHVFAAQANVSEFSFSDPAKGLPVVTGPYRVVSASPEKVILDRRDDWWGAKPGVWGPDQAKAYYTDLPAPKRIITIPHSDHQTMTQQIAAKQVDWIIETTVPLIAQALQRYPHLTSFTGRKPPYGYVDYWPTSLWFNHMSPIVGDRRVREAVRLTVDAEQAIAVVHDGAADKLWGPYPDFPSLTEFNKYAQDLGQKKGLHTVDRKRAATLMQEAGWEKDSGGFWSKDGKRWSATMFCGGALEAFAPVIVEQLRRGGFEAKFVKRPDYRQALFTGQSDLFIWGHAGASTRDPFDTLSTYHSKWAEPLGQMAAYPVRWRNTEFDKIVDRMASLPPESPEIEGLVHKALGIWMDEVVEVPISQWYHRIPLSTAYWTNWPDAEKNPYMPPTVSYWTAPLVVHGLQPTK